MFKESFKYYKSKKPQPDLSGVLDFSNTDKISSQLRKIEVEASERSESCYGLKPRSTWNVYEIIDRPGLLFIKNPFTNIGHRYWAVRCLKDYARRPNKSNLDNIKAFEEDQNWWELCQNNKNEKVKKLLRWTTLGYHHDWNTKVYSEDCRGEFPKDLANLSSEIAAAIGVPNFNAEAAIVNFYQMGSTLSGHADDSERNLEAPLISLSFGQTAIFLLGGKSKDQKPSAMFLRSGDIVIMTKESRLCYHGIPRILKNNENVWDNFTTDDHRFTIENEDVECICNDEVLWKPFSDYLDSSRINLNVRQVLNRGEKRLHSESEDNT